MRNSAWVAVMHRPRADLDTNEIVTGGDKQSLPNRHELQDAAVNGKGAVSNVQGWCKRYSVAICWMRGMETLCVVNRWREHPELHRVLNICLFGPVDTGCRVGF